MDGAIKGMLRQLDPHSQYLDEKAYANLRSMTEGTFGGIGVEVNVRDGYPTVIAPIEGTPAWEAGLRSGDVIVADRRQVHLRPDRRGRRRPAARPRRHRGPRQA